MKQNKRQILCLNASFFPIGTKTWSDAITGIFSGAIHPLDIYYAEKEDGTHDENIVDGFTVVKNWKEWMTLPIRSCDDYLHTTSGPVRLPSIVVCARFNRIIHKKAMGPSNQNIHKRDNYTCGYTGRKLQKHELSVDHILPISRGGKNEWTNLITCDKQVNNFKDNKTPEECGLKLLWKPTKPANGYDGLVFDEMRSEWKMFLHG